MKSSASEEVLAVGEEGAPSLKDFNERVINSWSMPIGLALTIIAAVYWYGQHSELDERSAECVERIKEILDNCDGVEDKEGCPDGRVYFSVYDDGNGMVRSTVSYLRRPDKQDDPDIDEGGRDQCSIMSETYSEWPFVRFGAILHNFSDYGPKAESVRVFYFNLPANSELATRFTGVEDLAKRDVAK